MYGHTAVWGGGEQCVSAHVFVFRLPPEVCVHICVVMMLLEVWSHYSLGGGCLSSSLQGVPTCVLTLQPEGNGACGHVCASMCSQYSLEPVCTCMLTIECVHMYVYIPAMHCPALPWHPFRDTHPPTGAWCSPVGTSTLLVCMSPLSTLPPMRC